MQAEASVVADTPKAAKDGGPATPGRCMYQTPTENSLKAAAVVVGDSLSRSVVAGQKEAAAALQVEGQVRHQLHALRSCNSDTFWISETDSATNRESITILREHRLCRCGGTFSG